MKTDGRTFLREFAKFKIRARRGETIRIIDGKEEFIFTAVRARRTLLGASKGRIRIVGDITGPTRPNSAWRPSLGD